MFRHISEDRIGTVNNGFNKSDEFQDSKVQEPYAQIQITRNVYDQKDLHSEMVYVKNLNVKSRCDNLNVESLRKFFLKTFPIISWLYNYKREDLIGDVISGATVCSMHIPGMGHALLAGLPPVVGINMAFYPALIYGIFASSKHNSIGTFSVLAIMTEKSVVKYATPVYQSIVNSTATTSETDRIDYGYTALEVAGLLCLLVGVIHLLMYIFRLGIIAFLLSDCLVSGLTTGAAFQIFSAQAKDFVGVQIPPVGAYFKIIKLYIEIFKRVEVFNYITLTIFIASCALLLFNNEWLKPRVAKKTVFPVPMELILIVLSMVLSKLFDIEKNWNVFLVGDIPNGLPTPIIPKLDLWKELIIDAFAIAVVSYSVSVSLGLLFAQKAGYEVDFNQELLAMGSANVAGAFFSCFPVSAGLGRSSVQFQLGGKTQLASFINVLLIMCILLWVAPLFEIIPRCVLGAIIVVAVKGLLMQVVDFKKFLRQSKMDALIWTATFVTVVFVAIDIGLLVGVVLSICGLLITSLKPHSCLLGHFPGTDLYLDVEKYEKAIEIPTVKIYRYCGTITFATKASFKSQLCKKIEVNLLRELSNCEDAQKKSSVKFMYLILDFSALSQIDSPSVVMLNNLIKDFMTLQIKVFITGTSTKIYDALIKNNFPYLDFLHPTVHDAVSSINSPHSR